MSDSDQKQYHLGKSFIFPKSVMDDIHIKSDLGTIQNERLLSYLKRFQLGMT